MRHARFRAHRKGIAFDLEKHLEDLQKRIDAGFCEVSGLPFNLDGGRTWDSPSFDRVDSTRGYTHDNVRVVLHAVNSALGDWGDAKMLEIARAIMARRTAVSNVLSERLGQNLMTLLEGRGAPEYELTWNRSVTPSGHVMYRLRASGRRTSGSGCTGWPTATAQDADLAGWPTPMAGSPGTEEYNPAGNTDSSRKTVALVGWPTPTSSCVTEQDLAQAMTAGNSSERKPYADSGIIPSSSTVGMGKPAALNPRFSLWLMGYPVAWASCGERAMQSCRKSPRSSCVHSQNAEVPHE
jgi:hypothetical protein